MIIIRLLLLLLLLLLPAMGTGCTNNKKYTFTRAQLTPRRIFLFEQLIVIPMAHKFPPFMESGGLLPCSQETATGPYSKPVEYKPHN
jgi:hypothetical protein